MTGFKFFLLALLMMNFTMIEQASAQIRRGPRYNPPGRGPVHRPMPRPAPRMPERYPQGRVSCSATDNGWEEHWSGHRSCGECVQVHGNCTEKCVEEREVCEVQGVDYQGRTRQYMAIGADRYSAESEARRQCEWDRDNRSCVTTSCRADNRMVSNRSCR
jgi:hypothetical protein